SWNKGNHSFKFGADLRWNRSDIFGGSSAHGNFTFDGQFTRISFGDFLLGMPSSAALTTLLVGNMRYRNTMFYALDDWKITPRLTLNAGIRYELTTPWIEKYNNMNTLGIDPGPNFNQILRAGYCGDSYACRGLVSFDRNNWAPRLGLAYQVTRRTVARVGAGVFYGGQGALGASARGVNNFPYNRRVTVQSTATAAALRLADGFPANFLGNAATPPDNSNWVVWQTDFPSPTVFQWNAAVQHEVRRDMSLTVAYVGSGSSYIMEGYNWNGSPPGPPATERQRRRIPAWNTIDLQSPYGHASYHGLDVQLERRYTRGLSLSAAYTWGHSIDNVPEQFGSGGGGLQDFRDFSASRGNSNFDARHRFVAGSVYQLPWGIQVSGLAAAGTGHYFTPTLPNARQRIGATAVGSWWPDRIASGRLENRTADRWFDTSAFVLPRAADGSLRLGNAGRAILNSDGDFNVDVGVLKSFAVTERARVELRWEVFNLTNTPTLGDPETNVESPDFGKVRSTVSVPRQMQFAVRVTF
ncbi:MAG: TonB-dependent receptor domain-containing protein, partial [Bryobacteraceae bacterium]